VVAWLISERNGCFHDEVLDRFYDHIVVRAGQMLQEHALPPRNECSSPITKWQLVNAGSTLRPSSMTCSACVLIATLLSENVHIGVFVLQGTLLQIPKTVNHV
jgi:hypothetical protein